MVKIEIEKGDWERIVDEQKNNIRSMEMNLLINKAVLQYAETKIWELEEKDDN